MTTPDDPIPATPLDAPRITHSDPSVCGWGAEHPPGELNCKPLTPDDKPSHASPSPHETNPSTSRQTMPTPIKDIATRAEFEQALKDAKGPVVVDFVMEGCGACEDEKPELEAIAAKCSGQATMLRVDVEKNDELSKLADDWNVEGTPTLLFAPTPNRMTPKSAVEVDPAGLRRKLKCARTKK